jgi:NitT/TauT family transport system substrate-binding protein
MSNTAPSRTLSLRFRLNHVVQGQNAPFLLAEDEGLFAREGLSMRFIEGFSSAQVTRALVAGEADIGFGDVCSALEWAMRSGAASVACLLPIFVRGPCSLGYRRAEGRLRLADLDGAVLCGPEGDMSARLLPTLLSLNGLGHVRYDLRVVTPAERDRMMAAGEARAATCFDATLKFSMLLRGHDSCGIDFLSFADHGLDIYSAGLLASAAVLSAHPGLDAVLGRVTRAAWLAARDDPDAAIGAAMRRNPALDASIARAQLDWVLRHNVFPGTQPPLTFLHDSARMAATVGVARRVVGDGPGIAGDGEALARAIPR